MYTVITSCTVSFTSCTTYAMHTSSYKPGSWADIAIGSPDTADGLSKSPCGGSTVGVACAHVQPPQAGTRQVHLDLGSDGGPAPARPARAVPPLVAHALFIRA